MVGYAKLTFAVFAPDYLLFILVFVRVLVHIRWRLYLQGRGIPREGLIVPWKGIGGGHHIGGSGDPFLVGGGYEWIGVI